MKSYKEKRKNKKKTKIIISVILIIIAILLLFYPVASEYINYRNAVKLSEDYDKKFINNKDKKINERIELMRKYNKLLYEGKIEDSSISNYGIDKTELLGYIKIPKMKLISPFYYGTSKDTLYKGVGILENTSIPVGGNNTNPVFSAHTGLTTQKLFTDLDKLSNGDIIYVDILNEDLTYKVDSIKVIEINDLNYLKIEKDKDQITLLTCYPYGINNKRLVVKASRVLEDSNNPIQEIPRRSILDFLDILRGNKIVWMLSLILLILIVLLTVRIISISLSKNKNKVNNH